MVTLLRTDSTHSDFIKLVQWLDADLKARDGEDHSFYAQFNKIDTIRNAVVAYADTVPVACGAFKFFADGQAEVKRMYVLPEFRRQGIAATVLSHLEEWAKEEGYTGLVLETGQAQPEALALYQRSGYRIIPNYGQYAGVENSVCFQKDLTTLAPAEDR